MFLVVGDDQIIFDFVVDESVGCVEIGEVFGEIVVNFVVWWCDVGEGVLWISGGSGKQVKGGMLGQ